MWDTARFEERDSHSVVQGRAGGACTSAILKVLYAHGSGSLSWVELLRKMRSELNGMGFDQVPQLTSSRMIDVNRTMHIVPPEYKGRRRAILSTCCGCPSRCRW